MIKRFVGLGCLLLIGLSCQPKKKSETEVPVVGRTPVAVLSKATSIYDDKGPVTNLNELEYVNGYVFANVWQTNKIVQIDLATGRVLAYLNMERILPPGIDPKENVLNGIAYEPTENALYVTGKNWPTLVKIRVDGLKRIKQGKLVL